MGVSVAVIMYKFRIIGEFIRIPIQNLVWIL